MDPPECSGHSHDHVDHGDDLGLSLRPHMDLPAIQCLNELIPNSGRSIFKLHEERLSTEPHVQSQPDDPELLFYIPFTENVTIQSISIRSVVFAGNNNDVPCPPKTIKLFVNRDDLDFETARELQPQATLTLLPPYHFVEGTIDYPLRPAGRFQNVSSLTIFVADNYSGNGDGDDDDDDDDEVSTIITYIGLKGKGTKQKRMAVETVYESQGMPKDHQVKSEFGNTQIL